jgi:hypothetical protein
MKSLALAVLLVLPSCTQAPEAPVPASMSESFLFTVESRGTFSGDGNVVNQHSDSEFSYSWHGTDREKTLKIDGLAVNVVQDGKPPFGRKTTREGDSRLVDGKLVAETPTPEEGTRFRQMFDAPICRIRLDEHGAEISREVFETPLAEPNRRDDYIDNAMLFYPPFFADRDRWKTKRSISAGNGGRAWGELAYEKKAAAGDRVTVKVSGELGTAEFQGANGIVGRNVRFVVDGEQVYDTKLKSWADGFATIDGSQQLSHGDKPFGTAAVTMKLKFKRLETPEAK